MNESYTATSHYQISAPPPPKPVGGIIVPIDKPIDKPRLITPWTWLSTIILPLVATVFLVKLKKKKQ